MWISINLSFTSIKLRFTTTFSMQAPTMKFLQFSFLVVGFVFWLYEPMKWHVSTLTPIWTLIAIGFDHKRKLIHSQLLFMWINIDPSFTSIKLRSTTIFSVGPTLGVSTRSSLLPFGWICLLCYKNFYYRLKNSSAGPLINPNSSGSSFTSITHFKPPQDLWGPHLWSFNVQVFLLKEKR